MKVQIDKKARAAYIRLVPNIGRGEAISQESIFDRNIILDFDYKGRLLGIELLDLKILHPSLKDGGRRRSRIP